MFFNYSNSFFETRMLPNISNYSIIGNWKILNQNENEYLSPAGIYLFKLSKHQNNLWSLFKVNNKDTTTFWCLLCWLWTDITYFYGASIADFEQVWVGITASGSKNK